MRIYTKAGDLAFKLFTFPDGQPHFILETYERDFLSVTIETAIRNPSELFEVELVSSVLRQSGYAEVNLDIRYLMGARMDRAIDSLQPDTLSIVAKVLNSCGFSQVRILDAHSETATRLIRGSENILPYGAVRQAKRAFQAKLACQLVAPDKGAVNRVQRLFPNGYVVRCEKIRDMQTGKLSGFRCLDESVVADCDCLIVDDICDGGGTFSGVAKVLHDAGARHVSLFVTHGIFSKGLPLDGIYKVFTTDSYSDHLDIKNSGHRPFENSSSFPGNQVATVIPISMKELI